MRSTPHWTTATLPAMRPICGRSADHTQFIVITHRRGTMEEADVLYGVTMQEQGVSKLLALDLDAAGSRICKVNPLEMKVATWDFWIN